MKKRIISILICLTILLCTLTACKDNKFVKKQKAFDKNIAQVLFDNNQVVAQNEKFVLMYDADKASVKLAEKAGTTIWSSTPTPKGDSADNSWGFAYIVKSNFVNSAIRVGYMNKKINGGGNGSALSYIDSRENGRIVCKQIENGMTIEYYFDNEEFMVPVDFILKGDYLSISIDTANIQENEKYQITYVDLVPFFCSVENKSYDTDEEEEETTTEGEDAATEGEDATTEGEDATTEGEDATTEGEDATTEGEDATTEGEDATTEGEDATTEGEDATTEGEDATTDGEDATTESEDDANDVDPAAESYLFMPTGSGALIKANTYDVTGLNYEGYIYGKDVTMEDYYEVTRESAVRMPVYGFKDGNVGGFFIIDEGAETAILKSSSGTTSDSFSNIYPSFQLRSFTEHEARNFKNTYVAKIFPENMIEGKVSVRFYPLKDDKANYTEMAKIYQKYLIDEYGLVKTGEEKATNVTIIGGTEVTKSFLGVPYTTVFATTTVDQANSIVTELSKNVGGMTVKLKGFGSTGVDIGKIGGNFTVNGNIGSKSQMKTFANAFKSSGVDLYMDYDLVRFNSGGAGFSYARDVVMNCGGIRADQFLFDKAVRTIEEKYRYRLLRPVEFAKAVTKSIDATSKFELTGISLETLSTLSYSDYTNMRSTVQYNSKVGFDNAVVEAVKQIKDQKFMSTDANVYAAIQSDFITDAPTSTAKGYAFIESVPFYAMVFKGYVPMASSSINLDSTPSDVVLGAIEGGMGLNYTVINNWDNVLIDALDPYFFASQYSSVKDDIINNHKKLKAYYDSINGATITSNELVAAGVHCTTFSNGVKAYVNYNNTEVNGIAANGYSILDANGNVIAGGAA